VGTARACCVTRWPRENVSCGTAVTPFCTFWFAYWMLVIGAVFEFRLAV
jgi:hypothetical protein